MALTNEAAEHMLKTRVFYTAAKLGDEIKASAKEASGLLYNIRKSEKYETECTHVPGRKVKVLSINGSQNSKADLWRLALGTWA
jgi:hypothetical protein